MERERPLAARGDLTAAGSLTPRFGCPTACEQARVPAARGLTCHIRQRLLSRAVLEVTKRATWHSLPGANNSTPPRGVPELRALRLTVVCIFAVAICYAVLVTALWWNQELFLFHPGVGPVAMPGREHSSFAMRRLPRPSGPLAFWAAPPAPGMPIILVFHGNGGAATDRAGYLDHWATRGWGVVLAEYPGWNGNPGGPPSEASIRVDALAYADWTATEWPGHPIVLWGESLGTGVAVGVAAARPVAAVVLDSPYTSIAELAALSYPWVPTRALIRHPFDTMALLPKVFAPVMVVHGEADTVVPQAMGRRIIATLPNPGPGVFLPGVGHTALTSEPGHVGRDAVDSFLERVGAALPGRTAAIGAPH